MALSYLSHPYKPEPYVNPLDLNVMAKVLSVEQGKFDQEGQKIQNQIDQYGSLDVLKGEDKNYLNSKVNSLVQNINNLGGVDLGDQQVASNIEGLGSDIYGDSNIVNAVAATRQIRSLQSSYQKMKSDPKLAKGYAPQNEAWDNQFVSAYTNDGKVGSSYNGPSSATPYSDYRSAHMKALQSIKANLSTNVSSDGLTLTTTEGRVVSPERVMAAAADLLLPQEKEQMEKDGWYAFKDANPLAVVQQSLNFNNQKLQDAQNTLEKYTSQAMAAGGDPLTQQKYKALADEQKGVVNQFTEASKRIQSQGLQDYSKDPHGYMGQVYKDQYYRGLGERFASSEVQAKQTSNPMALMQMKLRQQEDQFNQKMMFEAEKLNLKYAVDPITGKVTVRGGKAAKLTGGDLAPVAVSNTKDPDFYKQTEQTFADQNKQLDLQKADLFNSYWQNYLNDNPEISELLPSAQSGTGSTRRLVGQDILEKTNNKPGLQIEDFNFNPNESGVDVMSRKLQASNPKLSFADARAKVVALKEVYNNYDKLSHIDHNPDVDVSKIDPKLVDVVDKYQILNEKQAANNEKVNGVNKSIAESSGLTEADVKKYYDYTNNHLGADQGVQYVPNTQGAYIPMPVILPKDIAYIQEKLRDSKANDIKNAYYQNISNRPVYEHQIVTPNDPLVSSGYLPNLISTVLRDRGDDNKVINPGTAIGAKDIEVTNAGRNKAGNGYSVTANVKTGVDNKVDVFKSVDVTLDNAQAQQLGFNTDPYQPLNESVYSRGSSNPLLVYGQGKGGKPLVAKIRIVKDDLNDRVGQGSHAQIAIQTKEGTKFVNIPNVNGQNPSEVYSRMKTYINQFAQQGITLEQILDQVLHPEKVQ